MQNKNFKNLRQLILRLKNNTATLESPGKKSPNNSF